VQVLVNVLYIVILCPRKVPAAQLMVLIVVMVSSTYYILVSHLKKRTGCTSWCCLFSIECMVLGGMSYFQSFGVVFLLLNAWYLEA